MPKKTLFEDTEAETSTTAQEAAPVDVSALQAEIARLTAENAHLHKQIDEYNAWLEDESDFIHITLTDDLGNETLETEFYLDPHAVSGVRVNVRSGAKRYVDVYIDHGADRFGLTLAQWDILKPKLLTARKRTQK